MTIWAAEKSVASSKPVELVDLACGLEHWRQNSSPSAVVYDGQTYAATPGLSVGEIEESGNYLRSVLAIDTDWSNPFVKRFPGTVPDAPVTVNVYRVQGSDVSPWWDGYVAAVRRREKRAAVIQCVASFSALGMGSLCLRCGRACGVPLYSSLCGVVKADYEVNGVVESFTGTDIVSATFALEADGYWNGGPITINGYGKMVLTHTGDTVTISEVVPGLAVGMPFTAAPGCDHKTPLCNSRFANRLNYKGYPNLPTAKNPFTQGVY